MKNNCLLMAQIVEKDIRKQILVLNDVIPRQRNCQIHILMALTVKVQGVVGRPRYTRLSGDLTMRIVVTHSLVSPC